MSDCLVVSSNEALEEPNREVPEATKRKQGGPEEDPNHYSLMDAVSGFRAVADGIRS